jgi:arylformamidase
VRNSVFLDYTQDELDRAYDQRAWAPDAETVMARYRGASAQVRASFPRLSEPDYGAAPDETLDIFAAARGAPIHVHIHGGAWRMQSKRDAAFAAPATVAAGMHYVVPDFTNLPAVRMPQMLDQLVRALAWIHRNADSFGGDRDRILLSGHSSGAHLAAVLLAHDWRPHGLPQDLVKAALLVSGTYDLGPVMLSARRSYIDLTDQEVTRLSPLRHVARAACPVTILYGEGESPEFIRQARSFASALSAAGQHAELVAVQNRNHYEMNEELGQDGSPVFQALVAQLARVGGGRGSALSRAPLAG